MCTAPPAMRQPPRAKPISARAMVVLPEPDSPISASTSPLGIEKLTSSTMVTDAPASLRAVTVSPSTLTRSTNSGLPCQAARTARQPVDQEVHADRQAGDGERGHEDGRRAVGEAGSVLTHQRAKIGVRWLHAEPEEAEAAEQQHHEH